ncbi:sigma-70 family RNA polymerase sigma factor [Pseudoduganella ginsengisoli]|uniref:Sigma-70 family RNA polymerase sigma factor n=1 Tax=Pseudoduganella ginsengisoli TaxID=1462440 RepID=A0A6L6Q0P8_9BURK|nr:sigma-70 family RNA polymerase sigma factor [Pseudoduganella ginsengisoli]MTW03443.1 sigma-70 family RNA polymerase sigma factor [Pseudoduganella ginsengisoli]
MLRYKDGDLPAFQELYRRHSRGLYRFLSWHAPRREWADEIAQDSWINLHQARHHYQPLASFRTYLYQIARNRLLDVLRQPQLQLTDDDALFDHLSDAADAGADTTLEYRQRTRALHAAIHALPGEQKEALILQQFSGMSLDEIADLVAVPVETVKSRLRYAMKKLRQHYAADADREPV